MINIRIICVGKLKEQFYTDAANEYLKRLSGYCNLDIVELQEFIVASDQKSALALDKERAAIKKAIPPRAKIVALCVEGSVIDSLGLSEFLMNSAADGESRFCFIIGGSFGLHEEIKNIAGMKLSMSKMTFPHNLARVMLLEQLYRAFNITEGGKYHK